jgi:hypothetical protein
MAMQRPTAHTTRPLGQITRGKTAPNRLRGVDHFLAAYDPWLIRRCDGPFAGALYVDLGYGSDPITALESASRLRRLNPDLPLLGTEIKPERVERALPFADDRTSFRLGGFNLPLHTGPGGRRETVRLVRAFNVLRQYEESEALPAIDQIMGQVLPGGLLVDGTSDPYGRVWTASLIRRLPGEEGPAWRLEALVLGANLRVGFAVDDFQTRLPKNFIHRVVPGDPVFNFVEDLKGAVRDTRSCAVWGPRACFHATGRALQARGYDIARGDRWLHRGWLVWRNPDLGLDRRQAG